MADFARLVLASDTTGLRKARSELDQLTRTGASTEGRVGRSMRGMGASFRAVAVQAASMVAAFAGVGAALRGSQEIQQITNSLRALGMSTGEAEQALDNIASIADRTRAPLSATAQLFQRVTIAGRDLGASQEDVLRFTENVGLALGATGISAQEASGALLQLSQAMAGGTVRAEEFNSILEGAFPIAQAAANGIDGAAGSVGRLRAMVIAGEVSSREFFEAVISQSDALQQSFDQTEQTIGQATTGLRNSFNLLARETDEAFGISSGIAAGLEFLGDNLETIRAGVLGAAAVMTGVYLPAIVSATAATGAWIASLITLRGALMATGIGALIVGAGVLIDFMFRLRDATGTWGNALSALGDLASGVWEGIKTSAQSIPMALSAIWSTVRANFFALIGDMAGAWSNFISGITNAFTDEVESFNPITGERKTYDSPFKDFFKDAGEGAETLAGKMQGLAEAEGVAADAMGALARTQVTAGFNQAREALARLTETMSDNGNASEEAQTQAEKLKQAIDEMGGESGAAGRAAQGIDPLKESVDDLSDSSDRAADRFGNMIAGIVTGSQSAGDALRQLGNQLISSGISGIASSLFKNSGIGSLFAGLFDTGGMIPAGQFGIAGERGPEIVTGPARVTSRADTARMIGGQQAARVEVVARVENGNIVQTIREVSGPVAAQVVNEGLSRYDRTTLPQSIDRVNKDPRRRG